MPLPAVIAFAMPYIEPIIAAVIVDRLAKYGRETDWTTVKLDVNRKLRGVLPDFIFGEAGEDAVVLFVDRRISTLAKALHQAEQQKQVIDLLLGGKFHDAFELVWKLAVLGTSPPVVSSAFKAPALETKTP